MEQSEQLIVEGVLLTVVFTDYQRRPEYVSIQSVEHAGDDITNFIDDGVIGRALIKKLNAVADAENEADQAGKSENNGASIEFFDGKNWRAW